MTGKTLFFIPTAKTPMPGVWSWIDRTNYVDKLIVRNLQKDTAEEIAMQFFFQRDEYDYLIVTTDDVVGHPFQVRHLLDVEEEHGFPILSGWCNHLFPYASLCVDPIDPESLEGALEKPFPGLDLSEYKFVLNRDVVTGVFGFPFFKVWYTGIPLTLIQKETLKQVPFREWRRWRDEFCITSEAKKEGRGVMFDLQWAIDCAEKAIPITTDVRVFLLHIFTGLGEGVYQTRSMDVGKNPRLKFIPAVGEERSSEEMDEINALLREISVSAWKERKLSRNEFGSSRVSLTWENPNPVVYAYSTPPGTKELDCPPQERNDSAERL